MRFILLKVTTLALFLMLSAALTTSAAAATDQAPSDMGTVPASSVGLQLQLGAILNAAKHGGSIQLQLGAILNAAKHRDGVVAKFEPVNGPPELFGSALDAVRQWRYKPVILNGDPVEVDTTVKVAF